MALWATYCSFPTDLAFLGADVRPALGAPFGQRQRGGGGVGRGGRLPRPRRPPEERGSGPWGREPGAAESTGPARQRRKLRHGGQSRSCTTQEGEGVQRLQPGSLSPTVSSLGRLPGPGELSWHSRVL